MAKSTDGWRIIPLQDIGPIQLGMVRGDVKKVIGVKPTTFKKTPEATSLTDAFVLGGKKVTVMLADGEHTTKEGAHHVHVYYNADDRCEYVEVSAKKLGGPELNGRGFLNRPLDRTLAWAKDRDPDLLFDDSGFASLVLGISVHAPDEVIESVGAFTAEYFESYKKAYEK